MPHYVNLESQLKFHKTNRESHDKKNNTGLLLLRTNDLLYSHAL
jgi:hypothetical protein